MKSDFNEKCIRKCNKYTGTDIGILCKRNDIAKYESCIITILLGTIDEIGVAEVTHS
jgi:hypothetical protein